MRHQGRCRFASAITLVTGAAQGIGRAIAFQMAQEGATVLVADRSPDSARRVVEDIRHSGGQAHDLVYDLSDGPSVFAMFAVIRGDFGRLDVSIHNVGGTIWLKPFWEYAPEEIVAEIQASLWPTLWCCRAAVPLMIEARGGAIVNIGSFATRGLYRVPYAAAKGGVAALTSCLALETVEFGIRVNCVAPGGVDVGPRVTPRNPATLSPQEMAWLHTAAERSTNDTPMKRLGTPEEIAQAACFLASSEASYVTGQTLYVAGGGTG